MCLILFAFEASERYRLALAANRDEFYRRSSESARFWAESPELLAGKDLQAGGTWCGATRGGKFAAVTNFRDIRSLKDDAPSRGELLTRFLTGEATPAAHAAHLEQNGAPYNGYNLLFGDFSSPSAELWWQSNQTNAALRLESGVYGLSNHLLDTPWHKVERGKRLFSEALALEDGGDEAELLEKLFAALADAAPAPDERLPDTGVGLEWERMLSPIFIASEDYGTRSSTVILIDRNNRLTFVERLHKTATNLKASEQRFSFAIAR